MIVICYYGNNRVCGLRDAWPFFIKFACQCYLASTFLCYSVHHQGELMETHTTHNVRNFSYERSRLPCSVIDKKKQIMIIVIFTWHREIVHACVWSEFTFEEQNLNCSF